MATWKKVIVSGSSADLNSLRLQTVNDAGTNTGKFLVLDATGQVDYRTSAEVLSDIGAGSSAGSVYAYLSQSLGANQVIVGAGTAYIQTASSANGIVSFGNASVSNIGTLQGTSIISSSYSILGGTGIISSSYSVLGGTGIYSSSFQVFQSSTVVSTSYFQNSTIHSGSYMGTAMQGTGIISSSYTVLGGTGIYSSSFQIFQSSTIHSSSYFGGATVVSTSVALTDTYVVVGSGGSGLKLPTAIINFSGQAITNVGTLGGTSVFSSSFQVFQSSTVVSTSYFQNSTIHSGSYNGTANQGTGIISSSYTVLGGTGIYSSSFQVFQSSTVVSGAYVSTLQGTTIHSSSYFGGSAVWSSSLQLPAGIISSSYTVLGGTTIHSSSYFGGAAVVSASVTLTDTYAVVGAGGTGVKLPTAIINFSGQAITNVGTLGGTTVYSSSFQVFQSSTVVSTSYFQNSTIHSGSYMGTAMQSTGIISSSYTVLGGTGIYSSSFQIFQSSTIHSSSYFGGATVVSTSVALTDTYIVVGSGGSGIKLPTAIINFSGQAITNVGTLGGTGVYSSSFQVFQSSTVVSTSYFQNSTIHSGSYNGTANQGTGIISSSYTVLGGTGIISSSYTVLGGTGIYSSSFQIFQSSTIHSSSYFGGATVVSTSVALTDTYAVVGAGGSGIKLPTAVVNFSGQGITNVGTIFGLGIISGSGGLPAGVVSGSIQVDHDATTNFLAKEHIDWTNTSENLYTSGNGYIGGDFTVNGTLAFINSTNLLVKDQFILVASGSTTDVDGGIVVQNQAGGLGHALFYDASTTRWAVSKSMSHTSTDATALEFVSTIRLGATTANPSTQEYGVGEMHVTSDGEIWMYA